MLNRTGVLLLIAVATGFCTGCVDRRFVVRTNVPGAQIYRDGTALGPAPVDARYDYTGYYEFRAVAPGYEPLVERVKFRPKWYDYPGLDLIAEVLWPVRIEDVRTVNLTLIPAKPVQTDLLIQQADLRRARGQTLPPSSIPPDPPTFQAPK
jgi:PEGA domain